MLSVAELLRDNALVNGHWVNADSGKRFSVSNPADGKELATVERHGQVLDDDQNAFAAIGLVGARTLR